MLNVLITGGAGFIGSNLARYMLEKTFSIDKIILLDNLYAGSVGNIKDLLKHEKIKFIKGDIRDTFLLNSILEDIDVIVHLAALVDVEESFKNPFLYEDINSKGTLSMLDFSVKKEVDKFIYASSAAVYGDIQESPVKEDNCCHPLSPYAVTKLSGEYYCKVFSDEYGVNSTILRFFNVYGPNMSTSKYTGVIYRFLINAMKDVPPIIFGTGEQVRDFIYVDDVAKSIVFSIKHGYRGYRVYNVGTGIGTSILTLAYMILKIVGRDSKVKYASPRKGDVKISIADINLISREIGFSPSVKLEDGILKTLDYLRNIYLD